MSDNLKIGARAVIETVGAPKEFIEETLKTYIQKLKESGINIVSEIYNEGVNIEDTKFFSTFVEVDVVFKNTADLLNFCFDAMPSSIEIYEPEELVFKASELNGFLNDLQAKIHENDLTVKNYKAQNSLLDQNAMAVFQNFLIFALKQGPKSLSELTRPVGLEPEMLRPFLDKLIEKKKVKLENEKYAVA